MIPTLFKSFAEQIDTLNINVISLLKITDPFVKSIQELQKREDFKISLTLYLETGTY